MALQLVITNAGRAAVINQAEGGFRAVRIAAVGVSPTAVAAAPAATTLPGEVKRITSIAGEATAADVVHLTVTDESDATYAVRSFALYLSDGTLFALYGQADTIVEKSAQALLLLAIDVTLAAIPAAAITFGNANFTNPAATTDRAGVIELATDAEVVTGTDERRGVTPRSLARAYAGLAGARFTGTIRFGAEEAMRLTGPDGYIGFYSADEQIRRGYLQFYGASGALVNDRGGALHLQTGGINVLTAGPAGVAVTGGLSRGGNIVWDAGTDGAGSGLDADLLDGRHGSEFAALAGANFTGAISRAGAAVWDAANDGAGSGLDADTLDGRHAAEFALLTGSRFTGLVRFQMEEAIRLVSRDGFIAFYSADEQTRRGYLQFYGTSGALVNDGGGALHLQTGGVNVLTAGPSGVSVTGGLARSGNIVWDAGTDGAGSGLDADLLDGRHGSEFAALAGANFSGGISRAGAMVWDAANDGAGSGLDADTLDGRHAAEFALLTGSRFTGLVRFQSEEALRLMGPDGFISFYSADEQTRRGYLQFYGTSGALVNDRGGALHLQTGGVNVLTAGPGGVAVAGGITRDMSRVWDAGNDGAGSGLDADLLDGWDRDTVRDWNNLLNKPAAFPVAAHTHGAADIAGAFPASLAGNGYTVMPNGLILQWVTGAQQGAGSEGSQYVTFPIAFNACFQVFASTQVANVNTESHATYQLVSFGNEGATVMRQLVSSAGSDREPSWPRLFAIGR